MEKERLTQRQNEAYEFIRSYLLRNRKPPTLEEMGEGLGISSTNAVYKLLQALEQKGWIEREKHAARSIRLTDEEPAMQGPEEIPTLPIVSQTSSAAPAELWEHPRGSLSVDARLLRKARDPEACLIGRAGDDGMAGAGVRKGDLLLVEEMDRTDMQHDVLGAVLVREQLLARRCRHGDEQIRLRPTDRFYAEESFAPNDPDCYLIGPVLGLIRVLS